MTKLLYMADSYLRDTDAVAEDAGENYVVLDQTVFYPTSGGQESDTGTISFGGKESRVKEFRRQDGQYRHFLDGPVPGKGTKVHASIDWEQRHARMRMHTAQHVLSAVANRLFKLVTVGNQIYADKSRVDFYPAHFSDEGLKQLEEETNKVIDQKHSVKVYEVSRDEAAKICSKGRFSPDKVPACIAMIRIIDIEGVDKCPCAGTHVKSLGELGHVKILEKQSKGKDKQRLTYSLE